MQSINVADAKSRFSELLSRANSGERFLIQRRERPIAVLIGMNELDQLERHVRVARNLALALGQDETILEAIDQGKIHPAMMAFGLWRDDSEMEDLSEHLAKERASQADRPAILIPDP